MVNIFRRWFGASRSEAQPTVADWARGAGHRFAYSREGSGFVVEPASGTAPWRLEWGAPQRRYIKGVELRLRAEIGVATDLQMLVVTRPLMVMLEQQVFEDFTDGNQTRMGDDTPEEMRWLVLHAKVPRAELGPLRERFAVLSNLPRAAPMWLDGPLAQHLDASSAWLAEDQPMVLVVQRGRLTLRLQQAQPALAALQAALGLHGVALAAARRVAEEVSHGAIGSERPSTWGAPSIMPPSIMPPSEAPPSDASPR